MHNTMSTGCWRRKRIQSSEAHPPIIIFHSHVHWWPWNSNDAKSRVEHALLHPSYRSRRSHDGWWVHPTTTLFFSSMLCRLCILLVFYAAKKSGMDLTKFWHHIRGSAGNSFLWETCGPNVFRGDFHDSFALDLQVKDIRLFVDMAKSANVRLQPS